MDDFIGIIKMFGGNFAPRGWAFCNGQLLSISQHTALFSLIGTAYGGDGRTTFALPDLRGRAPVHAGTGHGLRPYRLGDRLGLESTTLSIQNIPPHTHTLSLTGGSSSINIPVNTEEGAEDEKDPGAGFLVNTGADNFSSEATTGAKYGGQSIPVDVAVNGTAALTGGGAPINNIQPVLAVNFIICMDGIYPSRS